MDPLRFPLHGSSLIEASAGTGKTFTIAALYMRLVLGHGGTHAFPRALTPPEILVVTFTEAATKELRDRIRARLAESSRVFMPETSGGFAEPDPLLAELRDSYPREEWPACAERLRIAAEWMDEAAVSTIHGWCNRMLREHAFDSGSLFTQALQGDDSELLDEAVRDYWRTYFYGLPAQDAECVGSWWPHPGALRAALRRLLPHCEKLPASPDPATALSQVRAHQARELAAMRAPWPLWCDELEALLDNAVGRSEVHGQKLQARYYKGWIKQLRQWCAGERDHPGLTSSALSRLSRVGLQEAWKVPGDAPDHPCLADLATLASRIGCLPEGKHHILAHAACWVATRLKEEKQRRAEMGFDDLLTGLHAALHGPNGDRLAELIRAQFPVALIDEFQDTDPIQYGIFRRVYGVSAGQEGPPLAGPSALVLIGDPKQAIYAFRGADIFTYLAARRDTEGHHASLGINFRSTTGMVAGVNRLFGQAEQRKGGNGAFLFGTETENPVPFEAVAARGRDETWHVEGRSPAALTCWWHEEEAGPLGGRAHQQVMAAACAAEVTRLLNLGARKKAGFLKDGVLRPVQPKDMAILVNGWPEAAAVRRALAELGVRSVYLSDQANVFCTAAAGELQRLLQACASPADGRLVRAALGTSLLALDWEALDRHNQDELHWETRLEQFRSYRERWVHQGVLPMVRGLLHDFGVPGRLIAMGDERQLTDVLHLAELLQHASASVQGEHALVRWLAEQRQEATQVADNRQQRLESDADLLKVVTVHKSKGLEYPLVFLPFASTAWPVRQDTVPLQWHDDQGRLQLSLEPDSTMLATAERERLGEDLRKLYVALTRARFATWVGVAATECFDLSAMGYLIAGGQSVAAGTLEGTLKAALLPCSDIAVAKAPAVSVDRYAPGTSQTPDLASPLVARVPRELWWVASYSRLCQLEDAAPAISEATPSESAEEETYREGAADEVSQTVVGKAASIQVSTLHGFPRGATDGTFLHGLLEWAGRRGFAATVAAPADLEQLIERRCQPARWTPHREALSTWMNQWLRTPLNLSQLAPGTAPVAPADLQVTQVEMEFWIGVAELDASAIDAAVSRYTLSGVSRIPIQAQALNGMLKGFIDLVFEHEGRYYVADYKSNRLGDDEAAYTSARMREEVLKHRYDLQYSLYLFALHRLLRSRLPDYDYEQHMGGAVYIFLRGHAASSQGLHLEKPPLSLMHELDRLFDGAEVAA